MLSTTLGGGNLARRAGVGGFEGETQAVFKKGCFGVWWGGSLCMYTSPLAKRGVTEEEGIGVGGGILGKMRPHLGKMRRIWAISMKSGQKFSRIGKKNQSL